MDKLTSDEILQYCLENLSGTVFHSCYGEKCIFYNPENKLKHGIYVLTIFYTLFLLLMHYNI